MKKLVLSMAAMICLAQARAQDTIAPTNESVGQARGEDSGNYNVIQSWELGYRYALVAGDRQKYESDVNYGDGLRLLDSSLTVNSRDGRGALFDDISLTTQGLGGDPYQSANLRIERNRWYRYDMLWRSNEYYDPGLVPDLGLHFEDLTQRWQDHDLILLPQRHLQFHAGYSRNTENGPALSTVNLFDGEPGNIFTLFSNVKREYNSYRAGFDLELAGIRLSVLHRWEFYKEDTPYSPGGPSTGLDPGAGILSGFYRAAPIHGSSPGWLVTLSAERRQFAINGRFTYSAGNRNFVLNESAAGTGLIGTENRLLITYGDAQRPVATGDFNATVFASDRLTITNNTSVANTRIDGNSFYEQIDLGSLSATVLNFQFLGIRLITNSTDAHYHASKKLDFVAGYRYSNRQVRSEQSALNDVLYTQTDHVNAGVAGIDWLIFTPLRFHIEAEVGRNDKPFYPISEKNYQAIDARLQYRRNSVTASAKYREYYNNNSITLTAYSAHARDYSANFSWAGRSWLAVDLGYSNLHLDTAAGIAFFANTPAPALQQTDSIYISNIHAANMGVRVAVGKRADVYLGYNITLDTGDGRSGLQPGTVNALLSNVQTFPLNFESPMFRLTIPISPKLKWNAGYQYYSYHEQFGLSGFLQNYHANTGYTSLLWAF